VLARASSLARTFGKYPKRNKVRRRETRRPARETRALPGSFRFFHALQFNGAEQDGCSDGTRAAVNGKTPRQSGHLRTTAAIAPDRMLCPAHSHVDTAASVFCWISDASQGNRDGLGFGWRWWNL